MSSRGNKTGGNSTHGVWNGSGASGRKARLAVLGRIRRRGKRKDARAALQELRDAALEFGEARFYDDDEQMQSAGRRVEDAIEQADEVLKYRRHV